MTDIQLSRKVPWGLIEFEQRNNGYRAYWVTQNGKRERYVSVTTFLNILAKGALLRWYEAIGMRNAIGAERAGLLKDIALDEVADTLRANKMGAEAARDTAAQRGVDIHAVAERYFREGLVPNPVDYPADHRGYIRALVRWLLDVEAKGFEHENSEWLVAHPELHYAGRADLRAQVAKLPIFYDFKTNQAGRVYPEHCFQVVAYAHADVHCGAEVPMDCRVVAFGADGHYEDRSAPANAGGVKAILEAYRAYHWCADGLKAARG